MVPLASWERRKGKENENYYNGLYREYYKYPFLHSKPTEGKQCQTLGERDLNFKLKQHLVESITTAI